MKAYTKLNVKDIDKNYIYQNYHKHSMYTNVIMLDSVAYPEDYAKRAKELGHGIISSCEHGYQGRYIESHQMAEKYGLKYLFAVEAYMVFNRYIKDKTNVHIILAAKNENGRKAINRILSEANLTGFYYRARIDYDLIMSLPAEDVWITTACLAGVWRYTQDNFNNIIKKFTEDLSNNKINIEDIKGTQLSEFEKRFNGIAPDEWWVKTLKEKFGENFYLEVQAHNVDSQRECNKRILDLSKKYNIEIIAGVDSHYILEEDAWMRDYLQKSGHIFFEEEQGFYMDYPDGKTLYDRFVEQGVLSEEDIWVALYNTNVFLNVEEYTSPIFNHKVKMPSAIKYQHLTENEKNIELAKIVKSRWEKEKEKIPQEKWSYYEGEIKKELKTIFEIHHSDYFLLNYEIIKNAVENKGGMITFSGRGSGPSFYVNHLLGFTEIDRISCPITLYPERFLSASRIKAGSLADIDFNCGNVPAFAESQKEILGEEHAYPMLTFGLLKAKSAWKMYCRANDVDFEIANQISAELDKYEKALKYYDPESGDPEPQVLDYIPENLQDLFMQSKKFLGLVDHGGVHACLLKGTKIFTNKGYIPIEKIQVGDMVLSHDNQFHKVSHLMNRETENYYNLKISTCENIQITGNHPMYVKTKQIDPKTKKVFYGDPYWKPVEKLTKNDKIGVAINQNNIIPNIEGLEKYCNNSDFWWFVGRFVGDGWLETAFHKTKNTYEYRIIVCCDKKNETEKDEIISHINDLFQYRIEESRTTYKIFIRRDDYLFKYLQTFNTYAYGKTLNADVLNLPVNLLHSFLQGYFSADGCFRNEKIYFSTVSEDLFYDLQQCIHKVYKCPVSLNIRKAQKYIIEERLVNGRKQYHGTVNLKKESKVHFRNFYEDGLLWITVKNKNLVSEKNIVYNMEIQDTHSYNVYGAVVHNCGYLLLNQDIKEEVGIMRLKSKGGNETIVTVADGKWVEKYLMLKNDLLSVTCVKLIYLLYDRVGIPKMNLTELMQACKEHPEVWDVYKNGYTLGVNQLERPSSKRKAMHYKPHNISELSALVAGIRPAFKSLIDKLINRENFSYNLPTFDKLLQTEELPQSFILYQEQIMKVLAFAGIPMDDCYTVIKSISKKRVEVIESYQPIFLKGFSQAIQEQEGKSQVEADRLANQIWGIIQDASAYGFNSSHSLSVSFDSLLAAYFKALYPLEFYEVYLNVQMERADKARAVLAKDEAKKGFNIRVLPMRFGQDNRKFTAYPEQNALSDCLKSIKGFGEIVGEEIFRLSKEGPFIDFLAVLEKKKELKIKINETQMEVLIKLNYFEEFGKNLKLLKTFKLYNKLSSRKTVKKDQIEELGLDKDIFLKYVGKETAKTYSQIDFNSYIIELVEKEPDLCIPICEQLNWEVSKMDIPITINEHFEDNMYYVLEFKTYEGSEDKPYLILYSLKTGELTKCCINRAKKFQANPFKKHSIIQAHEIKPVEKKTQVGKEWVGTGVFKQVLSDYTVIIYEDKDFEKEEVKEEIKKEEEN